MASMQITLKLSEADLDELEASRLASELVVALEREAPVEASLADQGAECGAKGVPIDWSLIILTLVGAQSVIGQIVNAVKPFFERHPELKIDFASGDKKLTLTMHDVAPESMKVTIEKLSHQLGL